MPTAGNYQRLSLEASAPGSDAEYYKARAQARHFFPLNEEQTWSLKFRGEVGYADTLGGDDPYPFYENYLAGGLGRCVVSPPIRWARRPRSAIRAMTRRSAGTCWSRAVPNSSSHALRR